MKATDRPKYRRKTTGRPSKAVKRLAEDFADGQMERQLKRQLKALDRQEMKEIILSPGGTRDR